MYTARPASLSRVGETTSGIRVGFVESNKVLTIIYIYIYYLGADKSLARPGWKQAALAQPGRNQAASVKSVMGRGVD